MGDSPNDQEETCITYYISDSSDDEGYEWETITECYDSDSNAEKFTLDDFYNKWQSQPCTSMDMCEYEDDEKRVGLRSESSDDETPTVDMIKRKVEEFNKKKKEEQDKQEFNKKKKEEQEPKTNSKSSDAVDEFQIYMPRYIKRRYIKRS